MYDSIIDESMFIARASEGAVSMEWVMEQPISVRKRYVNIFNEELKERKAKMDAAKR